MTTQLTAGETALWWTQPPMGRVTRVRDAACDAILVALDPLPETAPPVIAFRPDRSALARDQIALILRELESAALKLYPAWLPGAEQLSAPADVPAVRSLAFECAAQTPHLGQFLADLAEAALRGHDHMHANAFAPSVVASGLARAIAGSYQRPHAVLLVDVPEGLVAATEARLASAIDWLAGVSGMGVWLTGAPLLTVTKFSSLTVGLAPLVTGRPPKLMSIPPVAGKPRADSPAERALEEALATRDWAGGRRWHQTYRAGPLSPPYRLDLWWPRERCVVEVDGPEHCAPIRYAADRRRDAQLQLDGHVVLRYPDDQVTGDLERVVGEIELAVLSRR